MRKFASLTLTIPSWNSSIERVLKVSDFKIASDTAKYKLKYQLMCLISTTNNILKKNWRKYNYGWKYRRFTKSLFPKCILSKYLLKNLCSNQDYQRNLSIKHVQRAAANFDLYQINPVKVSRRDGINYVFNGQHTIEIVALVSGSRETPVWCMVYDDLVYTQEADIFANQMNMSNRYYLMKYSC